MATLRNFVCLFGIMALFGLAFAACSDDSGNNPANAGGNSTGGSAGNGGSANSGWKKGVVGNSKGVITLAKNAGRIQGFAVTPSTNTMSKLMDLHVDGGMVVMDNTFDASDEAGVPDTTPKIDLSGITPDFTEMWVPVSPYAAGSNDELKIALKIAVVKPDGTVTTLEPFTDWPSPDFVWNCMGSYNVMVNGNELRAYGGLSLDMADCMGRHFLISNMSDKVWEIYADGTKSVLVPSLPGPSAIMCYQGSLLISTLPQYEDQGKMVATVGVALHRVDIDDGTVTTLFAIPPTADYAGSETTPICGTYPGTALGVPIGTNIPFTVRGDGSYLVGDPGAETVYAVTEDGSTITPFAAMNRFTVSAILAPNDVVYSVEPPVIEWNTGAIAIGATINAYDGQNWVKVQELNGYEPYGKNMSNMYIHVDCPAGFPTDADCQQPAGGFIKITPGANPVLYITDPIKGEIVAVPLDMGGSEDAGTGGSAGQGGAAGSAGEGGTSGEDGSTGQGGSSGDGGSGGTGGDGDASAD